MLPLCIDRLAVSGSQFLHLYNGKFGLNQRFFKFQNKPINRKILDNRALSGNIERSTIESNNRVVLVEGGGGVKLTHPAFQSLLTASLPEASPSSFSVSRF